MEFCPKCGAILIQKKKNNGCPRCSYTTKDKFKITVSEKMATKKEVPVISNKETEVLPIVSEKCKKCKYDKAYFWTIQTRAGDESETKFFKCVKCSFTWRDYQ